MKRPSLSILMPAFNEGLVIYESLRRLISFLNTQQIDYEVIVSDDGSWDNTLDEARRAAIDFSRIFCVKSKKNIGKGHVLKNAFYASHGELIVFLDADLDLPPSQLSLFLYHMAKDSPDIIIGSKRHPDTVMDYPFKRKVLSNGYYFLLKLLFGLPIKDTQTGLKVFKRSVLEDIFPRILCKRFAYDVEILACAHRFGYSIKELPIIMNYDRAKWGYVGIKTIKQIVIDTAAIFYRMYIKRWYERKEAQGTISAPRPAKDRLVRQHRPQKTKDYSETPYEI